jgi:formate-nitrite transporter family protein
LKRFLPFIIVAVVALITVAVATVLYRSKRPAPVTISTDKAITGDKPESVHVRGPANAPVTLEEFGDFQCPPCGALAGPLLEIEKSYGPKLRVIFRNFPFAIHQHAQAAAYAAEAAGLQGRFWQMHDLLYREQATWSKAPDARPVFESYARLLALNIDQWKKDVESAPVHERVSADQQRGYELGVKNTPTIFINNRQLPPTSLNPNGVRAAIDEALKAIPAH